MASCYNCGSSPASYRRVVNTGFSSRTYYGKSITSSSSQYYAKRSVCMDCAKNIDWWNNAKVVFVQLIVIVLLCYLYHK